MQPEALLLDEPTAALDAETAAAAESLVQMWLEAHERRAVVWSTHDAKQAGRVADRQIQIANGRLIA